MSGRGLTLFCGERHGICQDPAGVSAWTWPAPPVASLQVLLSPGTHTSQHHVTHILPFLTIYNFLSCINLNKGKIWTPAHTTSHKPSVFLQCTTFICIAKQRKDMELLSHFVPAQKCAHMDTNTYIYKHSHYALLNMRMTEHTVKLSHINTPLPLSTSSPNHPLLKLWKVTDKMSRLVTAAAQSAKTITITSKVHHHFRKKKKNYSNFCSIKSTGWSLSNNDNELAKHNSWFYNWVIAAWTLYVCLHGYATIWVTPMMQQTHRTITWCQRISQLLNLTQDEMDVLTRNIKVTFSAILYDSIWLNYYPNFFLIGANDSSSTSNVQNVK